MLLGFPVFGFSLLCYFIFSITHISDAYPFAQVIFEAFVAILCLVLNLFNFYWMSKARKNPYYTDPLFPEAAVQASDQEAAISAVEEEI